MSFLRTIMTRIGDKSYAHLLEIAEKEVALAMQMPLMNENHQAQYYHTRIWLGELLEECEAFGRADLKILPTDVVSIIFKCKLLFAVQTEHEYRQRCGGFSFFDDLSFMISWEERGEKADVLIERYMEWLESTVKERTLVTAITSFQTLQGSICPQSAFESLFKKLGTPFVCFFEGDHLIEKHKSLEPGHKTYCQIEANEYFCAPSVGFTTSGSQAFCQWYSTTWLRTFLNMLRIAGYIHPGQRDFGSDVKLTAPIYPVFLGRHAQGCFCWHEDMKESWEKIPDGCLFLSFGYRGLSKMWLDLRTLPHIEEFMLTHKEIFENIKNPWNGRSINDIAPTLDLLSSATQIPDMGAKILLVYCCLEHLFVPKDANNENKKYIIGGLHALGPHLLRWFRDLYKLRCDYAHKGFVIRNDRSMAIVADSVKNVMTLLTAKLSVS
jgi:hypothetical protein